MDGPGKQILSCPALALDEHRDVGPGCSYRPVEHIAKTFVTPDYVLELLGEELFLEMVGEVPHPLQFLAQPLDLGNISENGDRSDQCAFLVQGNGINYNINTDPWDSVRSLYDRPPAPENFEANCVGGYIGHIHAKKIFDLNAYFPRIGSIAIYYVAFGINHYDRIVHGFEDVDQERLVAEIPPFDYGLQTFCCLGPRHPYFSY